MSFTLENIVPWGRSLDEYVAMFALSDDDLKRRIVGCGDGPASFNARLTERGGSVVSVDPLYRFSADDIRQRIAETFDQVMEQTRRSRQEFVWTSIGSVTELGRRRMTAMEEFLADYCRGVEEGRYLDGELPHLPFADAECDLALCSHLLFLYSEQLSLDFHVAAIREMCRVARDVRIFPLLELGARKSRHLQAVTEELLAEGLVVSIVPVPYEFQRGGNRMIRIRR